MAFFSNTKVLEEELANTKQQLQNEIMKSMALEMKLETALSSLNTLITYESLIMIEADDLMKLLMIFPDNDDFFFARGKIIDESNDRAEMEEVDEEEVENYNGLSQGFKNLNRNSINATTAELKVMKDNAYNYYGTIIRIGDNSADVNDNSLPHAFIKFDDDFQKILVKYDNQETTFRYTLKEQTNDMTIYGDGSVRYQETSGEPLLYMAATPDLDITLSLKQILE